MGLFNRSNPDTPDPDSAEEELALPTADDFRQPLVDESNNKSGGRYGIEEATALLRSLPSNNDELVIKVLKSTLESTGIQVGDIIADATRKEESIRRRRKTLHDEISNLQKQMDERHRQMETLKQDLDETISVRNRLQAASDKQAAANREKSTSGANKAVAPQPRPSAEKPADNANRGQVRRPVTPAAKNPQNPGAPD